MWGWRRREGGAVAYRRKEFFRGLETEGVRGGLDVSAEVEFEIGERKYVLCCCDVRGECWFVVVLARMEIMEICK